MKTFTRRTFLEYSGLALLTNFVLAACGTSGNSGGAGATTAGDCLANGTSLAIGTNHGHSAPTVSAFDVNAGAQRTYNLGNAGHVHTITVSAAKFASLRGNTSVTVPTDSDSTGHSHTITIRCV